MRHFGQSEWADFSRGLAGERETAMREHLQNCSQCREAAELWQRVAHLASQEALHAPPEAAVRIAKSYMSGAAQEKRSLATMVAELIFDSRREPALAGLRSATASARQLLFRSGDYEIDLRIQRDQADKPVCIVGQILSPIGKSVRGLPVALISGVGREATAATNEFGEFTLEFQPVTRAQVCVWLYGATKNLLIPLEMEAQKEVEARDSERTRGGR